MYFDLYGKVSIDASGVRDESYRQYLLGYWAPFAAPAVPVGVPVIRVQQAVSLRPEVGERKFGQFHHGAGRLLYRSLYAPYKSMALALEENGASLTLESGVSHEELHVFLDFCIPRFVIESGAAILHASAVSYEGVAHVFPAWGGIGKSSLVMNLLRSGAQYLGDDFVLVDENGVYPYPMPLNLLHYNLSDHWDLLAPVSSPRVLRYHRLLSALRKLRGPWAAGSSMAARIFRKAETVLSGRAHQHLSVEKIFSERATPVLGRVDDYQVYFMERRVGGDIEVDNLDVGRYARKMKHCLRWERSSYYGDLNTALLYAFPEREQQLSDLYERERVVIESFFRNARSAKSLQIGEGVAPARLAERVRALAGFTA
jgi:hypothetical protein